MENSNGKIIIAFFIGATIGAGAGLLLAPNAGKKTRKKIKHSVVETSDDVSNWLKHTTEDIGKIALEKKEAFEGNLDDALSTMSHKAEGIITSIEEKMEDIKNKYA